MCVRSFLHPLPASLSLSNLGLSELVESVPPAQQIPVPLLDPLAPEPHSSHSDRKAAEADACHPQVLTLPSRLWVPQPFIRSREGGAGGWRSERDSGLGGLPVTKSLQHQVEEEGDEQGLFEPDMRLLCLCQPFPGAPPHASTLPPPFSARRLFFLTGKPFHPSPLTTLLDEKW